MSNYLKDQFKVIKIEYLKVHNKTLCARRKNIRKKYIAEWRYREKDDLGCQMFELTLQIDAIGREILRLRGNKWSF